MEPHSQVPSPPLRILSLDGGGVRGISSLLILEHLMEEIRKEKGLEHVPRPCECFDVIGGTSTGGIIAIMLGRLRMSVDDCIREYREVAQKAFTPKRKSILPASPGGAFSATALENAIKTTCSKFCTEVECTTRQQQGGQAAGACSHGDMKFRDKACTKTVVLAITKDNVDAPPTLFTTYDESAGFHDCAIWQVARATSAATTFFKPIQVGRDGVEFVDAGFGYNNPCEVLVDEARRQFPTRTCIQVLSIGTGLGNVVDIGNTRMGIIRALKSMATSSKKVAARMDDRYGDSDQYFRFNVEKGLEDVVLSDWEKASKISAHTKNYIQEKRRAIDTFVRHFTGAVERHEMPASELGGEPDNVLKNNAIHLIHLKPNRRFVERPETEVLKRMLFENQCQTVALVGLGGVGKTQIALDIAYWTQREKPQFSVLWVPALSHASFEKAYTDIAQCFNIGPSTEDEDIEISVQRFLCSKKSGPWLLIVDNADDKDILLESADNKKPLIDYLPQSEHGLTLFTTRLRDIALEVAEDSQIEIRAMEKREAMSLLKKSLHREELLDNEDNDATAARLLDVLTYLPLAITQATAYLNRNQQTSIARYLELLQGTEQSAVETLSREFRDTSRYRESQNAVATTWLVSFEQIRRSDSYAAEILYFISRIEPKVIPRSILPGKKSEDKLEWAIGTLCSYSFLTARNDNDTFDMHSLVHLATRAWVKSQLTDEKAITAAVMHVGEIFPSHNHINRTTWRQYLPHALKVLSEGSIGGTNEKSNLWMYCGQCLLEDGRVKDAVICLEACFRWRKEHLAEEEESQLTSQHELARAYRADGRVKEAIKLLEHVVEVRERSLDKGHPFQLASKHELARAYQADGRVKEAIELLMHVVEVEETTLGEEHPSRLASQHVLASAYLADGRVKEAINLLEHVVEVRERAPDEGNPDRLTSQHELARAYHADGRVKEAIKLLEHVVEVRERTLDEGYPSRLASQHELSRAYQAEGRSKEAIELLEHVVEVCKRTLDKGRLDRLTFQHTLAGAYLADGRVKEAIRLLEHVVEARGTALEEAHPDRLASQHELSRAYQADGRFKQAIKLLEHIVEAEKKTLDEGHLDRLASQHELARAYRSDGQAEKAIKMLQHVVEVHRRTLNEGHPHRLISQHVLASTYIADGRAKEAIKLLEHVVEVRERTLDGGHPDRLRSQHELARAYQADGQQV